MEKVLVLYNPLSNNNRGFEMSQALKATAYDKQLEYIDITTIDNFSDLFANIESNIQIIVCGGDGTLNRFINNIDGIDVQNDIYYMPTGTGNDFFKDVNGGVSIPVRINDLIKDLPICEVNDGKYKFINGVGYGIDGYCCEVGDQLKLKSSKEINYTAIAIKGLLFHYKPTNATIIVDGVEHTFKKVWLAPIMKGKYYGGGMMPSPNQDRQDEDGKISVMVFHGSGKLKTLMIFPSIFSGEHIKKTKNVTVLEGHDITVKFDSPRAAQVDGETIRNVTTCHCYSLKKKEMDE